MQPCYVANLLFSSYPFNRNIYYHLQKPKLRNCVTISFPFLCSIPPPPFQAMDIINKIMNILIPTISLTLLIFVLPPYLFFKYLFSIARPIFSEDILGKVVVITGASSGIGEVNQNNHLKQNTSFLNLLRLIRCH